MPLADQISTAIKDAMKAKDKIALEALRAAKTAFTIERTNKGADVVLSDEEELKIIQKLVKQRKDSASIYEGQGRNDLSEKELAEAKILEQFLPAKLSAEELEALLKEIIAQVGANSPADIGKVMGVATKSLAGKAEGRDIASKVKELLA